MTVETKIASLIKNNNRAALIRMASKYQEKGIKNMNKRDLATLVALYVVETETQIEDREQAISSNVEVARLSLELTETDLDNLKLKHTLAPDPFSVALANVKSFLKKIFF